MKIKRICEQCGKEFEVRSSILKYGKGKFCSRECKVQSQITQEKRICEYCGVGFKRNLHELLTKAHHFCSKECYDNWQRGGKEQNECMCICEQCNKKFYKRPSAMGVGKNFCSRKCRSEWQSKNIEYKEFLRNIRKNIIKPTKPERIFQKICIKYLLPFSYVGNGQFWIGNLNPDFVECNGKKLAIEIFGDYWHSPLLNFKLKEDRTLTYRKKILKKYGWKLIMFWESDLLRKDAEQFVLNILSQKGIEKGNDKR